LCLPLMYDSYRATQLASNGAFDSGQGLVQWCFGWLKTFCQSTMRYERLVENFAAFINALFTETIDG
jgi:hypothetical protein